MNYGLESDSRWVRGNTSGTSETRQRTRPVDVRAIEAEVATALRNGAQRLLLEEAVTETLTRTAWHESGHAVVALALGLPVEVVSLDVDPQHLGNGATTAVGSRTALAIVALGGAMAERRFLGGVGDGCGHDEATVLDLRDGDASGATADIALVDAILERHTAAVQVIATSLLERGRLTGAEIRAVLAQTGAQIDAMADNIDPGTGYPDAMDQDSMAVLIAALQRKIAPLADSTVPADQQEAARLQELLDELLGLAVDTGRSRSWDGIDSRYDAGGYESRTTVGLLGRPRPVPGEIRHATWIEYNADQPPDGRSRQWVEVWNQMGHAANAGNWPLHRTLQDQLVQIQDAAIRTNGTAPKVLR